MGRLIPMTASTPPTSATAWDVGTEPIPLRFQGFEPLTDHGLVAPGVRVKTLETVEKPAAVVGRRNATADSAL
jgi:hypothetical protein